MAMMCSALTFNPITTVVANAAEQSQHAQGITGTVLDDQGEPIIGATIVILNGSNQGTITDLDGRFKVNVKPGTKLQISYVGYDTQTVVAKNGMKITLKSNTVDMEGVEVVAYGVQKKVTVTGAISSVKSEDLVRTSVGSVNNVLGGQLSGVTTVQYSGEPGSDAAEIFVRGKATWGDATPLIQVDGVERSMNDIDPNEIESVTVLKDASATAVFGVRGANGVVLITTKRGKEGKAKISVSTSWSALSPTKMVEQASSYDYALFYNQQCQNDGLPNMFSDSVIEKFRTGSDPIRFASVDWADYLMKDVTLQQQHNLNISGGTEKARYFISAGFYSQGGLFEEFDKSFPIGFQYHRFNYRANLDLNLTKRTLLTFGVAGNVGNVEKPNNSGGTGAIIKNIYFATPFSTPGFVDGKLINGSNSYEDLGTDNLPFVGGTGIGYYTGGNFLNNNTTKLQMDASLEQKLDFITQGLLFKLKGSYNSSLDINKSVTSSCATYTPKVMKNDDGSYMYNADGSPVLGYEKYGEYTDPSYGYKQYKGRDWYFETSLNYNRSFGKHTVSALALYNQSKNYYYKSSETAYILVPRGYVGLVGRVTYDWSNRYMAEFNVGYNGSENFPRNRRYGVFPAGSIGWIVSEEKFFEPVKDVVSFFKLRASVGKVGNDKIGTKRFAYVSDPYVVNSDGYAANAYVSGGEYRGYIFGQWASQVFGNVTNGAYESGKNNPNIGWENALKQDYGVDMNFLGDRLRATFDYYYEHRTDILLIDGNAPAVIGFTVPYTNDGETKSWGYEVSLGWNDKIGENFRYWTKLNLSYNQNEIIEMKETTKNNEYQYAKGHRIGSRSMLKFWKYYYEGCEADYVAEFGKPFPTALVDKLYPGDCVYVDLDGNGKIDDNDKSRDYGYTDDPEYMLGFNMGFAWKRLTFNAQFTGAWNVSRMISSVFRQPFVCAADQKYGGLLQYHVDDTWTPSNTSQSADYPRATWTNSANNYAESTLYEKDAKYLRLKTLSVGYDFNNKFFKSLGISKFELALSGYNLLTFTPYKWGDPETTASASPSYPLQRTYTASLNVSF